MIWHRDSSFQYWPLVWIGVEHFPARYFIPFQKQPAPHCFMNFSYVVLHDFSLLNAPILSYPKVASTMFFTIQYSHHYMYCIGCTSIQRTNEIGSCEFASTCIYYLTRSPKSKEGFLSILNSFSTAIDMWVQIKVKMLRCL